MPHRYALVLWAALGATTLLNGCAPIIVAGAGTAAVAAHDRRTVGAFIDDQAIEVKVRNAIHADETLRKQSHINITSVNGIVLLSGEVPTAEARDQVLGRARTVAGIRQIVNEIQVAPASTFASRSHDTWLTTKVKTNLVRVDDLDSTRVKVVTENDVVYLLGLVTKREADSATEAARTVSGVARVVKLFEYID